MVFALMHFFLYMCRHFKTIETGYVQPVDQHSPGIVLCVVDDSVVSASSSVLVSEVKHCKSCKILTLGCLRCLFIINSLFSLLL